MDSERGPRPRSTVASIPNHLEVVLMTSRRLIILALSTWALVAACGGAATQSPTAPSSPEPSSPVPILPVKVVLEQSASGGGEDVEVWVWESPSFRLYEDGRVVYRVMPQG